MFPSVLSNSTSYSRPIPKWPFDPVHCAKFNFKVINYMTSRSTIDRQPKLLAISSAGYLWNVEDSLAIPPFTEKINGVNVPCLIFITCLLYCRFLSFSCLMKTLSVGMWTMMVRLYYLSWRQKRRFENRAKKISCTYVKFWIIIGEFFYNFSFYWLQCRLDFNVVAGFFQKLYFKTSYFIVSNHNEASSFAAQCVSNVIYLTSRTFWKQWVL